VPDHPAHPDHEELATWQAGALVEPASGRIVAHLAGCADCAAVVSAVERGRTALAGLEEPELPPGLHERLAAAIEREAAARALERAATGTHRRAGRARRRWSWSPRVAALSAAAALVLLVAGLVPVLRHAGGDASTQLSGGAAVSRPEGAPNAAGALPVFAAPGGYSGSSLRSAVAGDPAVRDAYARAAGAEARAASPSAASGSAGADRASPSSAHGGPQSEGLAAGRDATAGVDQPACLGQVRARTSEEVRAAFFVDTVYQGRPATVLVTRRAAAPDQAELWAFPRGDCSTAPFASERVQIPPP